ncbi:Rpn family recombination-promoting nuclease/putative transposase [Parabacteroides distasonis]|nr:Rpn family recombination-promoting nuclease/putative transposase [Parabacteroides distasonis]
MRYLDPKADLTFKRVFGEHPDLVISLLNALLPIKEGEEILSVEYLPSEMVPENPLRKNSIVDVRCRDQQGRQYIVEMQMIWSPEFMQRVLFNSAKAYVRQLKGGEQYELLEPVYSLNLVNEVFEPELKEYYHYYQLVHVLHTERVIDGLHLVFVELPKFTPHTFTEKRMQALWLRFLTEIQTNTRQAPQDLLADPQIRKALSIVEESAYTDEQLLGYDKFWDVISVEKTLFYSANRRGMKQGLAQGLAQGIAQGLAQGREQGLAQGREEGREEGREQEKIHIAQKMKALGMDTKTIEQVSGLTAEQIEQL